MGENLARFSPIVSILSMHIVWAGLAWAKYINIEYSFNNKTKEHKNKRTCSFQVYIPLVQAISCNSFQVYLFWLLMALSRKSGFPLFVEH